jgi:hypothetical protein
MLRAGSWLCHTTSAAQLWALIHGLQSHWPQQRHKVSNHDNGPAKGLVKCHGSCKGKQLLSVSYSS